MTGPDSHEGKAFVVRLVGDDRTICFASDEEEIAESWAEALSAQTKT